MNMIKTTAQIDPEGWLTIRTRVTEKMDAGPVEVVVVLQPVSGQHKPVLECIHELRKLGPVPSLENPVEWQRANREDRDIRGGN